VIKLLPLRAIKFTPKMPGNYAENILFKVFVLVLNTLNEVGYN